MERYDHTLASTRVPVLDLYLRKASCLRSMFYLLRQLPSCGLDNHQVPPKLLRLSICIKLMVALAPTIPWISPPLSLIST
ncbi:hypothetical protein GW17_00054088 [Ensete ventricosum]|nr:hypothetical protein GW17_00054088 [Ensete ventricosum]